MRNDSLSYQVGGSHYDMPMQPWEFLFRNDVPYGESAVFKYVVRHTSKNGRQDLEKAFHYTQMILDSSEEWGQQTAVPIVPAVDLETFIEVNEEYLRNKDLPILRAWWSWLLSADDTELIRCADLITERLDSLYCDA